MTTNTSSQPVLIPWGRLADGKLGHNIDDTSGVQLNSVLEVWQGTDPATETGTGLDFPGRIVLMSDTGLVYIFDPTKGVGGAWRELGSLPATVGVTDPVTGLPPIVPTPLEGEIFWATDTEVAYVWDGTRWQPIGGRYAGYFKAIYYGPAETNGARVTFSLGLTVSEIDSLLGAESNVEVFLDGVRQSALGGAYTVAGGNVRFFIAPPAGTTVYMRTLVSDIIAPTAEVEAYYYDVNTPPPNNVNGTNTQFELGSAGVNQIGTSVYVNGVHQKSQFDDPTNPDYQITSQDTTITQMQVTNVTPGSEEVTVTTTAAHNASIGAQVILDGVTTEPLFNGTYIVQSTPTAFTFTVENLNAPAIGLLTTVTDAGMFYTPPFQNDVLEIPHPTSGDPPLPPTAEIVVRVVRNLVASESTGEANDGANIGAGVGVFKDKLGDDLRFRSILAGANISVVDTGNEVLINASSGLTFEDRNGINTTYHLLGATESYIGILSTAAPVTIDLASVADVVDAGRRIVIVDESGGAATNNITIIHAGKFFNGGPNWVIDSNYGTVTLVFSGSNWFATAGVGGGGGGGGAVTSVFGRTGAVIAQSGDYNAIKIDYSNTASGLTSTDVQNAIDEIAAIGASAVPPGVMAPFGGSAAAVPTGWILCDGKTIGNNLSGANLTGPQYEDLFNIVKTMTGDGNTGAEDFASNDSVKLPDLRGRIPVGPDNMGGGPAGQLTATVFLPDVNTPGSKGGEDQHVLSQAEMPIHRHDIGSQDLVNTGSGTEKATGANNWGKVSPPETEDAGGSQPHNNLQPMQIVNWIIKL